MIGLTGTFGSGKSTVARMFEALGARVLDADQIAHETFRPENPLSEKVRALLGLPPGEPDRRRIAAKVFADEALRRKLEALVHPYVFGRLREETERLKEGMVVLDVPLLFETGLDETCDRTVFVEAPREAIRTRLGAKGYSDSDIESRQRAQMPAAEKKRCADFVVDNSGDPGRTQKQVEEIIKKIHHVSKGEQ